MTKELWKDSRIVVGGGLLTLLTLTSLFAMQLAPHHPYAQDLSNLYASPSREFWLGTDGFGRDSFSRLLVGGRFSLLIGVASVTFGCVIGTLLGMIGGYTRGWFDLLLMRLTDALMTFPTLLLALLIVATLGPTMQNLILAIGIAVIPRFIRIMRSAVIAIAETDYVMYGKVVGASPARILRLDVLPNIVSPLIVTLSFTLAGAILAEASLGFLGLGAQPPVPTWGNMINDALPRMRIWPAGVIYPGFAIMLAVLALNLLGDGLRDVLDPKTLGSSVG